MARVLVTGATGFVGRAAAQALADAGFAVRTAGRRPAGVGEHVAIGDLRGPIDWAPILADVSGVVHLAALAHRTAREGDIEAVNVRATAALGAAARAAGVRRFVFLSSVKAVGEESGAAPLTDAAPPCPSTAYGHAKRHAELALAAIEGLDVVALRPPLVHAPDAKANFAALLRLAASPAPIPLGGLANRRSLIARDTLCAAIVAAAGDGPSGAFLVADDPPLSTSEIIAALRRGLDRRPGLLPTAPFTPRIGPLRMLFASLAIDDAGFRGAYPQVPRRDSAGALADTARRWAQARRR